MSSTQFGLPAVPYPDGPGHGYPVNSHGESYGSAADAPWHGGEPDLIAACATNGRRGYVRRTELRTPPPASPEEAVAMMASRAGRSRSIHVYEQDGRTVVGEFVMT
jgi:hypothetical protein